MFASWATVHIKVEEKRGGVGRPVYGEVRSTPEQPVGQRPLAVPVQCDALAYLADQFWYPQSSINLLEAIEVPQGQIQLV